MLHWERDGVSSLGWNKETVMSTAILFNQSDS
jgi:hypothetical protein